MRNKKNQKTDSDLVWGAEGIGAEVNLPTVEQARYHLRKGTFGDAVKKVGHKYVGWLTQPVEAILLDQNRDQNKPVKGRNRRGSGPRSVRLCRH